VADDDIYEAMIQKKGLPYRDDQIKTPDKTHYRDPIDHSPGRVAGNSHIWGDASPEAQSKAIDAIITAAQKGGLDQHQTAYVLAMARVESGFNPDAAAGTTTAYGLGQFVGDTAKAYAITPQNMGDLTKQAEALVETYKDDATLAKKYGHSEEYIYKYHHDGPAADFGGLELSKKYVMPYVAGYEKFVQEHAKTHPAAAVDPNFDSRNRAEAIHHGGHQHAHHAVGVLQQGDRSEAVGDLQSQLRDLGYTDHKGRPINPDKSFGNDTKSALQKFQANNGLEPDGIAGTKTLKALKDQDQALLKNPGPYADAVKQPRLNDPAHPDHQLFQQAYDGVKKIDAEHGRVPDHHSVNLAGALAVEGKARGLKQIDVVALSADGSNAFAAQKDGRIGFPSVARVDTAQAVNTPIEHSTQQMVQVNQQQAQVQAQVQAQMQVQNQALQATQGPQMGGPGR